MNVLEFLRTVYLGDRACKRITIDGWNATVSVQVDVVSRIRNMSGQWSFYTAEDIVDGLLVFEDVTAVELKNAGHIPNDAINDIQATEQPDGRFIVEISVESVEPDAQHHETILLLVCGSMHLVDPDKPELKITQ